MCASDGAEARRPPRGPRRRPAKRGIAGASSARTGARPARRGAVCGPGLRGQAAARTRSAAGWPAASGRAAGGQTLAVLHACRPLVLPPIHAHQSAPSTSSHRNAPPSPVLKRELAYCEANPDELSRAATLQQKVAEVKGVLIANLENVRARMRALRRQMCRVYDTLRTPPGGRAGGRAGAGGRQCRCKLESRGIGPLPASTGAAPPPLVELQRRTLSCPCTHRRRRRRR